MKLRVVAKQGALEALAASRPGVRAAGVELAAARAEIARLSEALKETRAATALAALCVGDQVRINLTVSPKYLYGACGRVIDLDEHTATVCLHRPVGRFKNGHIRCPPLALQPQAAPS